jgi:hypothetical protein
MGQGGEGIEFLSLTISKYNPNKFRPSSARMHPTQPNRYLLSLDPVFYRLLGCIDSYNPTDIDYIVESIYNSLPTYIKNMSAQEIIDEAILYNERDIRPAIHSQHFSYCSYYTKQNSYLLYLDTYDWFLYKNWIHFKKVWDSPIPSENFETVSNCYFVSYKSFSKNQLSLYEQFKERVEDHIKNGDTIYEGHLQGMSHLKGKILPDNYFYKTPLELFQLVDIPKRYATYKLYFNQQSIIDQVNIINYTDLINQLITMFEIPKENQNDFSQEVYDWHNRNLLLLENINVDFSKCTI